MPRMAQGKSFEEMIDMLANSQIDSIQYNQVMAEIKREQILSQQKTGRYMLWSTVAAAVSALCSVVAVFVSVLFK